MSDPIEIIEDEVVADVLPHRHKWRTIVAIVFVLVVLYGSFTGILILYGKKYQDKVLPGVFVGAVGLGGMDKAQLSRFFQSMNDRLLTEGVHVDVKRADAALDSFAFYPVVPAGEDSTMLITLDPEKEANSLLLYGKKSKLLNTGWSAFVTRVNPVHLRLSTVVGNSDKLVNALRERIAKDETPPKEASINITQANPLKYAITTSSPGVIFAYDDGVASMIEQWKELKLPSVSFSPKFIDTSVHELAIAERVGDLPAVLSEGLTFTYTHPDSGQQLKWAFTPNQLAGWIEARKSVAGNIEFGLSEEKVKKYIAEKIAPGVTVEAKDAKFRVDENGKVVEFQGSRAGVGVAVSTTYNNADMAILNRVLSREIVKEIPLVMEETLPTITTADVNNLGITGVLGVGISSFAGSPTNRVINIRNAVKKLNGIIVKPGEEFSTIEHTKPFTLEGGYLPEKVIKGDEIKPEIGGGLCQIGSTLFRMAMNSGMPITERRNHSLVVPYYNDLRNKLPGTDATIYDPAPDFKFLNDTGNNVLIQTDMNTKTAELRFTLWGTSDGRKGSYSPPVVKRWIPYGETKTIETTKLKPGEKECQHAYTGADTLFTYYRVLPDGTKEDRVFESHYRPLPEICLVGVEPKCEAPDENGVCPEAPVASPDGNTVTEPVPVAVE